MNTSESPPVSAGSQGLVAARPSRLSEQIGQLLMTFGERPLRLGELMASLSGRAYTLLLIVLSLPFCTPIPLPGLSFPFGVIIAILGFQLALQRQPRLPNRLLQVTLPPKFFTKLLAAAQRFVRLLERLLRPRYGRWIKARGTRRACGLIIMVCGALLLLPLPIPFSNSFPAVTVVLTAGALLESDGACLMAALACFMATLCFYAALAWGGLEGINALYAWADWRIDRQTAP